MTEATYTLGALRLTAAAGSDVGTRYAANFDVVHLDADLPVAVVADGMGSGRGSTLAGRTTVDTFVSAVRTLGPRSPDRLDAHTLRAVVADIQQKVTDAGAQLHELTGCTLTALVGQAPDAAWIVQVGDSRAYRLREGLLEQLTTDHTMAWIGVLNGWFPVDSREEARARYHLTRYVGHPERPEPDLLNVALRPGDVLCLCTDGVAEQVPYRRLLEVLTNAAAPAAAVATLLADCAAAGGSDNATVIVISVGR